jgi:RNA polymerase sigma-70 factor (ECF subfamily)
MRVDDGLIADLYAVNNPAKLSHVERETTVSR